jgi:hypothetical protein
MMLIGSKYFFSNYQDFIPHDTDELEIIETNEFKQMRQITTKKKCLFQMKKHDSKEPYIEWALQSKIGMVIGKFLVPEFCQQIGFTVDDLPKLKVLIERLDDKHRYEEIIYNSYIENNSFTLTPEQRDRAYKSYKDSRLTN